MSRKDGKLRPGEITRKDMNILREGDRARTQHDSNTGVLRDYGLQHRVSIKWGMNPESERDRIFTMKVDDYEVLLDAEEVMRLVRWV